MLNWKLRCCVIPTGTEKTLTFIGWNRARYGSAGNCRTAGRSGYWIATDCCRVSHPGTLHLQIKLVKTFALNKKKCLPGSIGRTGSVLGIVKYPLGFGSQHLATTSLIGLNQYNLSLAYFLSSKHFLPRLLNYLSQHFNSLIIGHIFEVDVIHL